jgi:hypothetical protein
MPIGGAAMSAQPEPISPPDSASADIGRLINDEVAAINRRRGALGRPAIDTPTSALLDATGLCLSGGGVRSTAVCLGVLQAFNQHNVLRNIDYLSTVSGGGFVGTCLTATMTKTGGEFIFGHAPPDAKGSPQPPEINDTRAVGHIRTYANYMFPAGPRDIVYGLTLIVRGIIVNAVLVAPVLLLLAALLIWGNPSRSDLTSRYVFGTGLAPESFSVTLALAGIIVAVFFFWAVARSLRPSRERNEFRTLMPRIGALLLFMIVLAFFAELQAPILAGMFDRGGWISQDTIRSIVAIAAPAGAVIAFFRQQLGDFLKAFDAAADLSTRLAAYAAQAALWLAGAIVPLFIWIGFLQLCYWGIINDVRSSSAAAPTHVQREVRIELPGINLKGTVDCSRSELHDVCGSARGDASPGIDPSGHTPRWLIRVANMTVGLVAREPFVPKALRDRPVAFLYVLVAILLSALSWLVTPNAYSLHRMYRDRLSKAFLFAPPPKHENALRGLIARVDSLDLMPLDSMRVGDLSTEFAPYHLMNASLNISGSSYARRRGRSADFFLFSPLYVGSSATGFARTTDYEVREPGFDLATAMATSAAAISPNTGGHALTLTFALLNIRIGYWSKNPRYVRTPSTGYPSDSLRRHLKPFLLAEVTGRLSEEAHEVYLTDGGHIENLGLYELLRRRVRVIVVVDAEADLAMQFPSLIRLQRYARTDLGIRISLPWRTLQDKTVPLMGVGRGQGMQESPKGSSGPHVAIGTIDYGEGQTGYLVYIKCSLSGDENDYIRDYARRFGRFPHESTSDQFFSQEQFEVYRALGFHMAHGMLSGKDAVAVVGAPPGSTATFADNEISAIAEVRRALIA